MTRDEIYSELKLILIELFEIEPELITLESNLYEDLDIDSIDAVDINATEYFLSSVNITDTRLRYRPTSFWSLPRPARRSTRPASCWRSTDWT